MEVKPKKKRSIWLVLIISLIVLSILGRCVGSNQDKTPTTPAAPVKTQKQIDDEKRKANNERIIAESNQAQANARASSNNAANSAKIELPTESKPMDFAECQKIQASIVLASQGTSTKVLSLINSDVFTSIRVCTTDGSVLIGCNKPDGKMVITKSPNRTDCTN